MIAGHSTAVRTYITNVKRSFVFIVQLKSIGQILFDSVVHKLQLVESDYFDIEYTDQEAIPVSQSHFMHYHSCTIYVEIC